MSLKLLIFTKIQKLLKLSKLDIIHPGLVQNTPYNTDSKKLLLSVKPQAVVLVQIEKIRLSVTKCYEILLEISKKYFARQCSHSHLKHTTSAHGSSLADSFRIIFHD